MTRPLLNLPPRLASAIVWTALDLQRAPATGRKRLEIESRLGALLVVANGAPLGWQGPLNPEADPYPARNPDGSPDLGPYASGVMEEFADLLKPPLTDPDLTPLAVRDIRPGDAVDLEGAPGCTGDSFFGVEFELAEVVSFEAETPDCIRLDFAELPSVGFDPATILPTRKGSRDFWLVGREIKGAKPGEPGETLLAGFFSEGEAVEFLDGPTTDKAALHRGEYSITGPADD